MCDFEPRVGRCMPSAACNHLQPLRTPQPQQQQMLAARALVVDVRRPPGHKNKPRTQGRWWQQAICCHVCKLRSSGSQHMALTCTLASARFRHGFRKLCGAGGFPTTHTVFSRQVLPREVSILPTRRARMSYSSGFRV